MATTLVLAIGGHALSPKHDNVHDCYEIERDQIERLRPVFARLAADGHRLLIVHGNGPQVGRLMNSAGGFGTLDIHVAQSQGELGYLLASALPAPAVSLVTRVEVSDNAGEPTKPIGAYLDEQHPTLPCRQFGSHWRVTVPSPRPAAVLEIAAVQTALCTHHVVAGGGGGVPVNDEGQPVMAVVDKDWVALELALAVDAAALVFMTDVDYVYTRFGYPDAAPLKVLTVDACEELLDSDELGVGSMHPKLAAATDFVRATGRSSSIGKISEIETMLAGQAGTLVISERASRSS